MTRPTNPARVLVLLLVLVLLPSAAYAYIDPGTTSSLFGLLAPLLAMMGVFVGYLLWPFRRVIVGLFCRAKKAEGESPPAEPEEQAPSE